MTHMQREEMHIVTTSDKAHQAVLPIQMHIYKAGSDTSLLHLALM